MSRTASIIFAQKNRQHNCRRPFTWAALLTLSIALASCTDTQFTAPSGEKVSVCHGTGPSASLLEIYGSELQSHLSHGDYVAGLRVDHQRAAANDGIHYARITDALKAVRAIRAARSETTAAPCRVTITVAAGTVPGSVQPGAGATTEEFPLLIDFPAVTLRGAYIAALDGQGRATGLNTDGVATTLTPAPALLFRTGGISEPLIIVDGHPDGLQGNDVTIEGFIFQSGHVAPDTTAGGQAVFAMRVHGLVLRGNVFGAGFTESIDLRASSGIVTQNHLGGGGGTCDICFAGPGVYEASGNRLLAGGIPGILTTPATLLPVMPQVTQYVLPASSTVTATIDNNEVRNHLRKPVGVGIRFATIGVGAPNVSGQVNARVTNNDVISSNFGLIVEAGFPVASGSLRGDIDLMMDSNHFTTICQNVMLVSFSRHTTGLGLTQQPYLRNSNFKLSLGDFDWSDVWYSHPASLGNTLTVDGVVMPNGSRVAYDAARSCPAA